MRFSLLLTTAALASASPLAKRQVQGGFLGTVSGWLGYKPKLPATTKAVEPVYNKAAVREIVRWGPYILPAAGTQRTSKLRLDGNGDPVFEVLGGLCTHCMVLAGSTYVTYENETVADIGTGVYNHHVFVGDMGKKTRNVFSCGKGGTLPPGVVSVAPGVGKSGGHSHGKRQMPGMPIAQVFGSGDDGAAVTYAVKGVDNKVGFYVSPSELIFTSAEFINYRKEEQKVYLTIDIEYMKGKPEGWRDGTFSAMAATGCGLVGFIPPGNTSTTLVSAPYTVTADGTMYNAQGHLHDGGIDVQFLLNGKPVCTSRAKYGGEKGTTNVGGEKWETIQGYDRCDAIDVKKGDQIVVTSTYNLVEHRLRPDAVDHSMGAEAMALMGFVFAEKPSS